MAGLGLDANTPSPCPSAKSSCSSFHLCGLPLGHTSRREWQACWTSCVRGHSCRDGHRALPGLLPVRGPTRCREQGPGQPPTEEGRPDAPGGQGTSAASAQPGLTDKVLQKCRRWAQRPALPLPTRCRLPSASRTREQGRREGSAEARGMPITRTQLPATLSLQGLPPPDGHRQPSLAGGWENAAHSAKGKHLTQP